MVEVPDTRKLLAEKREDILRIAARHGAFNVRLFASAARGEARPDSDIDLLVVVSRVETDTMPCFVRLLRKLESDPVVADLKAEGVNPNPYPIFMTPQNLEDRPLILLDILDHGIILCATGVLRHLPDRLRHRLRELDARTVT